ncbi:tetrahydroberberine oxidase-like [Coffea arabica]|uniref:Tetrahydroberberine oxidase-like n=1 Tax=Coffea arabica TaxID=13443 RepID=A0A6P6SA90_COFAR|nr:berberine bridge enzyme-like 4 [Coffea arabica]
MRILSGGHDFEGRSYVADVPFFILNMFYFRSISIDAKSQTAWVGAAATLGETYYAITQFNSSLAFPAGYCPTIAFGGHVSGGGHGPLVRKYGLAGDNVIDARIIDASGRVLDRESMGEDLFWAIRGGTGASFGVILAYKIKLVEVPKKFTAFSLTRTLQQNATKLVHQWQSVAPKLPADLLISLQLTTVKSSRTGKSTVAATFVSAFRGGVDELLYIMQENFPELGLVKGDCTELSWVEYIAFHFGLPKESTYDMLLGKITALPKDYFKAKSDLVQRPIPEEGLEKIWDLMKKMESPPGRMEWIPFGARMDEIPESEIPFPHRAGNLFLVFKTTSVEWNSTRVELMQERIAWLRKLHAVFGKYVAKNPRGAYVNYKDLDLGVNNVGKTSVEKARIWGAPYFKNNFDRLVQVKTKVDPYNFFKNEQSIPISQ